MRILDVARLLSRLTVAHMLHARSDLWPFGLYAGLAAQKTLLGTMLGGYVEQESYKVRDLSLHSLIHTLFRRQDFAKA